ncbi:MAG: hypothetical protein VKK04_09755 [Synechococcales bacterium]|nr:hypothetical protein [Synechococcales bacterium]
MEYGAPRCPANFVSLKAGIADPPSDPKICNPLFPVARSPSGFFTDGGDRPYWVIPGIIRQCFPYPRSWEF